MASTEAEMTQKRTRKRTFRVTDLPKLKPKHVQGIKAVLVRSIRQDGQKALAAEKAGVTVRLTDALLEDDPAFRELFEQAHEAWTDEVEKAALEASSQKVTGKIFLLKGHRPERFHERIAQDVFQHEVYEPEFKFSVLTKADVERMTAGRTPAGALPSGNRPDGDGQ